MLSGFTFPTQAAMGNIFQSGQTVQIPLRAASGNSVHWTVTDFYGNAVASGITPISSRAATVLPSITALGYYDVQLAEYSNSTPVSGGTGETTFAILAPATSATGRPSTGTQFGVQGHFANGWATSVMPLISKAGMGYVRDEQWWQNVEPNGGGNYAWDSTFTGYMSALNSNGISIVQTADFANSNYDGGDTPYTSSGNIAYANYANALVGHYGSQIQTLEVWNEYNGSWCTGTAATDRGYYYTQMLQATYNTVKASHPNVTILGGAGVTVPLGYYDEMFKDGALSYMDGIVIHPYEAATPYLVEQEIATLNAMMLADAGKTVPIYVTECGLNDTPTSGVGQQSMATYMVQLFASLQSQNVKMICWYDLENNGGESTWLLSGATDAKGAYVPNAGYVAYANYVQQMAGASFNRLWTTTDPRTRVYQFTNAGQTIDIAYSTDGATSLTFNTTSSITVVDIVGKVTTYSPTNGQVTITIGQDPVFIKGDVTAISESRADAQLANSVSDFVYSTNAGQNQNGWYYGYASNSNGSGGSYNTGAFRNDSWTLGSFGYSWTNSAQYNTISAASQEPTSSRWAIRRWVSNTAASVTLSSTVSLVSSQGDGVVYEILVNGSPILTQTITSTTPATYTTTASIKKGDLVDFVVTSGSGNNQNYDATALAVAITAPAFAPVAPSFLVATAASSSQIELTWTDNATNESGFYIERSTDAVHFSLIGSVGAGLTGYSDATFDNTSPTIYYRVQAYNSAGASSYSAIACLRLVPVSAWYLNENGGTTAADAYGSNNGLLNGGSAWTMGKSGSAVRFDGVSGYVGCGNDPSLNDFPNGLTLAGWFYQSGTGSGAATGMDKQDSYGLIATDGSGSNGSRWQFYVTDSFGTAHATQSTQYYSTDAWHYVVGTFDGDALKLYVDGQLAATTAWTGTLNAASTYPLEIGRGDQLRYFAGAIDEVKVYSRALIGDEIAAAYSSYDLIPPTGRIAAVSPNPSATAVNSLTITFSEPVAGFDLADLVLSRNGGSNLLTGSQTLTTSDNTTFVLGNLAALTTIAGSYAITLNAQGTGITDLADNPLSASATQTWQTYATVAGRWIFYNNSYFDGNNAAAAASDDAAIATDKQALLPGQTATFADYTSSSRGINGIMIDVSGLPGTSLSASDFGFLVGNNNTPSGWASAPAPSSVTVRPGAGLNGSDRVELIWADNAIQKQWLEVTLLADATTGLATPDVFYFGNAIGETGNSSTDAAVTNADVLGARGRQQIGPVPLTNLYDFNRDGAVNNADVLAARGRQTAGSAVLQLIMAPTTASPMLMTAATTSSATAAGLLAATAVGDSSATPVTSVIQASPAVRLSVSPSPLLMTTVNGAGAGPLPKKTTLALSSSGPLTHLAAPAGARLTESALVGKRGTAVFPQSMAHPIAKTPSGRVKGPACLFIDAGLAGLLDEIKSLNVLNN